METKEIQVPMDSVSVANVGEGKTFMSANASEEKAVISANDADEALG